MTEAEFKKKLVQEMEKIEKEREKKDLTGFVKQVDEHAKKIDESVVYMEIGDPKTDVGSGISKIYMYGKPSYIMSATTVLLGDIIKKAIPRVNRIGAIMAITNQLMKRALDDNE